MKAQAAEANTGLIFDPAEARFDLLVTIESPEDGGSVVPGIKIKTSPSTEGDGIRFGVEQWMAMFQGARVSPKLGTIRLRQSVADGQQILDGGNYSPEEIVRLQRALSSFMGQNLSSIVTLYGQLPKEAEVAEAAEHLIRDAMSYALSVYTKDQNSPLPKRGFLVIEPGGDDDDRIKLLDGGDGVLGLSISLKVGMPIGKSGIVGASISGIVPETGQVQVGAASTAFPVLQGLHRSEGRQCIARACRRGRASSGRCVLRREIRALCDQSGSERASQASLRDLLIRAGLGLSTTETIGFRFSIQLFFVILQSI